MTVRCTGMKLLSEVFKSVKKKKKKKKKKKQQKTTKNPLPVGLWPWHGWWVLNQQETESSFLQTRFTTHNKSFTKHCGPTSPPPILHLLFNTLNELIWVTGHSNRGAVSRNRYGLEKTVDTHKILINAIQCYVCLQEIW